VIVGPMTGPERKAVAYALLAAAGWAFEHELVVAVAAGGLVGALVDVWSSAPKEECECTGGTGSPRS
jgi:hypothetical protein